ncbi:TerB family tellurite resistance protein [bacterium SCSIO 12696]|nr:TerB family tellurite resistance protein [bacterium SCSIO 12696]
MHIVLTILGAIVTILILVRRLDDAGISLNSLNPFWYFRRRKWQQQYNADPGFCIESPMEATAGLMYVAAKCSGDISREQKSCMLTLFQQEFHLSERESTELLASCSFLIPDEDKVKDQLSKFLEPSVARFSDEQRRSAIELVEQVIACDDPVASKQQEFFDEVKQVLQVQTIEAKGRW